MTRDNQLNKSIDMQGINQTEGWTKNNQSAKQETKMMDQTEQNQTIKHMNQKGEEQSNEY